MAQLADLQQADGRLRYLVDDGVFDSNPCRVSCFLNPLYDLLPRNAWLVQQGVCQARPLHLSTPLYTSLSLPISPEISPTSPLYLPGALRLPSGRGDGHALLPLAGQLLPQHGARVPGAVHHRRPRHHLHFERHALPWAAAFRARRLAPQLRAQ